MKTLYTLVVGVLYSIFFVNISSATSTEIPPDTLVLHFKPGWSIFSTSVMPDSADMKFIFKPLIDSGKLIKIQDENGNALEDYGVFGGWKNNIGNISLTEGYKIKVRDSCQLTISGKKAVLPFEVPLKQGWNIVAFPGSSGFDGLAIVQQLINRGTLVKLQDENGNAIEDYGSFGGWNNNVGNLSPGEGYKVKVTSSDTLSIFNNIQKKVENVITVNFPSGSILTDDPAVEKTIDNNLQNIFDLTSPLFQVSSTFTYQMKINIGNHLK